MKKFFILMFLALVSTGTIYADSLDSYNNFMKSLKLSDKQATKIDGIDKKYRCKATELRANIILRNMQLAQSGYKNSQDSLNYDFNVIQEELNELQSQKEDEVASTLGLIQRFKYRKYCKNYSCY